MNDDIPLTPAVENILKESKLLAKSRGDKFVRQIHLEEVLWHKINENRNPKPYPNVHQLAVSIVHEVKKIIESKYGS